jgi:hypothetical protein
MKLRISNEFTDLFEEFGHNFETFKKFCDKIIFDRNEFDKILYEESHFDQSSFIGLGNSVEKQIYEIIADYFIKNKEIFQTPKYKSADGHYETPVEHHLQDLLRKYFDRERQKFNEDTQKDNKQKIKEERASAFYELQDGENMSKNQNDNKEIPVPLRIVEFLVIVLFFIFTYFYMNIIPISDIAVFNQKILNIFNENGNCIEEFTTLNSPKIMNKWLLDCVVTQ